MIIRIFRVEIDPNLREEFESEFSSVSIDAVTSSKGYRQVSIAKPTKWTPNEYAMISEWDSEDALEEFVGENWNEAFIPEGMAKFVRSCSVHHYHRW